MLHLDEGTVHAWLDGELSADDAERAARHVAECAECAALIADARGVMAGATRIVSALDAGPVGVVPRTQRGAQPKRRAWYRFALTPARMSIAATILVAAGVTLTVQRARIGRDGIDTTKMSDGPRPAATTVAPPVSATDSMAVVPEVPKAAPVGAIANAQKTQNSPLVAARPSLAKPAAVGGAPLADKERTLEPKARPADSIERAAAPAAPAAAPAPVPASIDLSARARPDSARAKDEAANAKADAGDRAAQPALERRQVGAGAGLNQLAQAVATDRDALSATGASSQNCYHLDIDSTEWRRALPSAFALGPAVPASGVGGGAGGAFREPAGTVQSAMRAVVAAPGNAVHAVTATGRVDSLVVGDWRPAGPALVSVHFAAAAQQKPVRLILAVNDSTAQLIWGERTGVVRVVRMTCAR
jgi:Putative zinc-finger